MPKFLIHQVNVECDCEDTYPDTGVSMSDYCEKVLRKEGLFYDALNGAICSSGRCTDCCRVRPTADNVGYTTVIALNKKYDPSKRFDRKFKILRREGV